MKKQDKCSYFSNLKNNIWDFILIDDASGLKKLPFISITYKVFIIKILVHLVWYWKSNESKYLKNPTCSRFKKKDISNFYSALPKILTELRNIQIFSLVQLFSMISDLKCLTEWTHFLVSNIKNLTHKPFNYNSWLLCDNHRFVQ